MYKRWKGDIACGAWRRQPLFHLGTLLEKDFAYYNTLENIQGDDGRSWQQKNMERKQRANWWLVHHPTPIPHKTGEITGSPTKGALPSAYLVPPPHPTPIGINTEVT